MFFFDLCRLRVCIWIELEVLLMDEICRVFWV